MPTVAAAAAGGACDRSFLFPSAAWNVLQVDGVVAAVVLVAAAAAAATIFSSGAAFLAAAAAAAKVVIGTAGQRGSPRGNPTGQVADCGWGCGCWGPSYSRRCCCYGWLWWCAFDLENRESSC